MKSKLLENKYIAQLRKDRRKFERGRAAGSRRGIWEIVNTKRSNGPIELEENGTKITGAAAAEKFADFFEYKPKSLRREPEPEKVWDLFNDHVRTPVLWDLQSITECDLKKLIDGLKPKRSVAADGISYYMLKQFKFEVLPILLKIINGSVLGGIYLEEWKIG